LTLWTPPGSLDPRIKFDEKGRAIVEVESARWVGTAREPLLRDVRLNSLPVRPNRRDRRRAAREGRRAK
jgi:hypothetical protein